jgi:uncharacterized protein YxjI
MRYVLKQKLLGWGDDYRVRDEAGNDVFFVDGKVFTLRNTLVFQDMQGKELARIQKKLLAWGPTYEIYRDNQLAAVVKKHLFTFLRCKFTVDVPGPNDFEAQGNFFDYEYTFERGGREVAVVSKRWFSWSDTYGIDVHESEDAVLMIASAVVIDQICHEEKKG